VRSALRIGLALAVAVVITDLGSRIAIRAQKRAEAYGRYLGQCDVIVIIDKTMKAKDPTWTASTPKLVSDCQAALTTKEETHEP